MSVSLGAETVSDSPDRDRGSPVFARGGGEQAGKELDDAGDGAGPPTYDGRRSPPVTPITSPTTKRASSDARKT